MKLSTSKLREFHKRMMNNCFQKYEVCAAFEVFENSNKSKVLVLRLRQGCQF